MTDWFDSMKMFLCSEISKSNKFWVFVIYRKLSFSIFADGHLQKLLLTACRDVAVVVVVDVDVVEVVEVVAGGHLQVF